MLDGINSQAAVYTANISQEQTERFGTVTSNSEHEEKVNDAKYVRTAPGQKEVGPDGRKRDSFELSQEAEEIRKLQSRDREVRAHEAAHAAAGGAFAGSPSYTFERGPDGQSYATGGEVSIDVSPIAGDPQATLHKAQQIRAAALAPAEPSAQDMKIAQRAQIMAAKASMELSESMSESLKENSLQASFDDVKNENKDGSAMSVESSKPDSSTTSDAIMSGYARLTTYA